MIETSKLDLIGDESHTPSTETATGYDAHEGNPTANGGTDIQSADATIQFIFEKTNDRFTEERKQAEKEGTRPPKDALFELLSQFRNRAWYDVLNDLIGGTENPIPPTEILIEKVRAELEEERARLREQRRRKEIKELSESCDPRIIKEIQDALEGSPLPALKRRQSIKEWGELISSIEIRTGIGTGDELRDFKRRMAIAINCFPAEETDAATTSTIEIPSAQNDWKKAAIQKLRQDLAEELGDAELGKDDQEILDELIELAATNEDTLANKIGQIHDIRKFIDEDFEDITEDPDAQLLYRAGDRALEIILEEALDGKSKTEQIETLKQLPLKHLITAMERRVTEGTKILNVCLLALQGKLEEIERFIMEKHAQFDHATDRIRVKAIKDLTRLIRSKETIHLPIELGGYSQRLLTQLREINKIIEMDRYITRDPEQAIQDIRQALGLDGPFPLQSNPEMV